MTTNLDGYKYVACRHYLHAWNELAAEWKRYINVVGRKQQRRHVELVLEVPCYRCPVVRIDSFNPRSFERISRFYDYSEAVGYLQDRDGPKLKKRDFTGAYLTAGAKNAVTIDVDEEE